VFAQSSSPDTPSRHFRQNAAVIPANTAVVAAIPQNLQIDVGKEQVLSTTLLLAQPIVNASGQVAIPANTPVQAKIQTGNGQARIIVESLIIGGRMVSATAVSSTLHGTTVTVSSRNNEAKTQGGALSRFGGSLVGALGGNSDEIIEGSFAGNAIGILEGLASPKEVSVLEMPQGTIQVLTLKAPVPY
jgi:hypothetical protein